MLETDRSFDYVKINLASPARIRGWGERTLPDGQCIGEVTKPETINYRTLKPEMSGLFCERIFGPVNDWECHCGKYKRVRHKGIVCERCGVEVIESNVRRHRMGFVELASPVTHVWYVKGRPSKIALILNISLKELEQVVYFNSYIVLDGRFLIIRKQTIMTLKWPLEQKLSKTFLKKLIWSRNQKNYVCLYLVCANLIEKN